MSGESEEIIGRRFDSTRETKLQDSTPLVLLNPTELLTLRSLSAFKTIKDDYRNMCSHAKKHSDAGDCSVGHSCEAEETRGNRRYEGTTNRSYSRRVTEAYTASIPASQQRLLYLGRVLDDYQVIVDLNVQDHTVVQCSDARPPVSSSQASTGSVHEKLPSLYRLRIQV